MSELLLSDEEQTLLAGLIGQELLAVTCYWAAELSFKNARITIQPDEILTPTEGNPRGEIVTLRVLNTMNDPPCQGYEPPNILTNCGNIVDIFRLESFVEIENPAWAPPIKISEDFTLPAGEAWSNLFHNPTETAKNNNSYRALLGLQFKTSKNLEFTLYCNSIGYCVDYHEGPGMPEELTGWCEIISINS